MLSISLSRPFPPRSLLAFFVRRRIFTLDLRIHNGHQRHIIDLPHRTAKLEHVYGLFQPQQDRPDRIGAAELLQ
jgi:hypothetical protein